MSVQATQQIVIYESTMISQCRSQLSRVQDQFKNYIAPSSVVSYERPSNNTCFQCKALVINKEANLPQYDDGEEQLYVPMCFECARKSKCSMCDAPESKMFQCSGQLFCNTCLHCSDFLLLMASINSVEDEAIFSVKVLPRFQ